MRLWQMKVKLELEAEFGHIYYTLDGTEPTTQSSLYREPISLDKGETLLTAVAVNEKGMVSDKLVYVYKINFDNASDVDIDDENG